MASPAHGWIEVITGSMFSGKSEELIRRLRRAQIARQKVQIFKPLIDDRFSDDHIVSHSDMRIRVRQRASSDELLAAGGRRHRSRRHRRGPVLRREPARRVQHARGPRQARHRRRARSGLSGPAVRADAAAAGHRRIHHQDARHLRRLRRSGQPHAAPRGERDRVLVGATGMYEARCRHCFDPAGAQPRLRRAGPRHRPAVGLHDPSRRLPGRQADRRQDDPRQRPADDRRLHVPPERLRAGARRHDPRRERPTPVGRPDPDDRRRRRLPAGRVRGPGPGRRPAAAPPARRRTGPASCSCSPSARWA